MQQVIIAIHLMVVVALVVLVLYQKSEGGALGMGGGQGSFFTGRGQANALTRATGILATIFFLTSIALTVLPAWERRAQGGDDWTKALDQSDVMVKEIKPDARKGDAPAVPLPEAGKDSIFDQLQRAQQKRQQGAAPAPAPAATEKPALRPTESPASPPAVRGEIPNAEGTKAEAPSWLRSAPEAPAAEPPKSESPKPGAPAAEAPKSETAPAAPPPVQWKSPTQ